MDHATRAVLAQRQVGGAPEEVPAFAPLLVRLDLAGVVVTADALQTHPEAAEFLVGKQHAHYLFQVKANQPTLLARCAALPWHRVPVLDRTRDRGHGRIELRTLKAVSVHHLGFPHAAQVLEVTRKTRDLHTNRWRAVTVYAITSLSHAQASPARLADLLRNHWAIEALHHLRDVTFAEDACKVRTGSGPHVMATLRNLVIGVLCRAGPVNVTAALRHHARDPRPGPSPPSGSISDETVITTERRSPARPPGNTAGQSVVGVPSAAPLSFPEPPGATLGPRRGRRGSRTTSPVGIGWAAPYRSSRRLRSAVSASGYRWP
jgi:predicted transposase YbfD/YdcC